MDLPIEPNRKKGKSRLAAPALAHQQGGIVKEHGIDDENAEPQPAVQPANQVFQEKTDQICPTCQKPMLKRGFGYCPNKCPKNRRE